MDIDALYEEISKEIDGSDELLEAEVEARRSELSEVLNRIAVAGFGVSAAFGMFQLPFFAGYFKGGAWFEAGGWLETLGAFAGMSVIWSGLFWLLMALLKWITDKRQ